MATRTPRGRPSLKEANRSYVVSIYRSFEEDEGKKGPEYLEHEEDDNWYPRREVGSFQYARQFAEVLVKEGHKPENVSISLVHMWQYDDVLNEMEAPRVVVDKLGEAITNEDLTMLNFLLDAITCRPEMASLCIALIKPETQALKRACTLILDAIKGRKLDRVSLGPIAYALSQGKDPLGQVIGTSLEFSLLARKTRR